MSMITKPDPRTLASITMQGKRTSDPSIFRCGCHERPHDDRWYLCDYHEGYDDALGVES